MTRVLPALLVPAIGLLIPVLSHAPVGAQAPGPTFEVASIKRNNSTDGNMARRLQPGGTTLLNMPLRQLIMIAYGVQPFQVVGGPPWLTSDRFDILAKAEGTPSQEDINLMLRALLADRFKLVVHIEKREMQAYSLVKARADGRLGAGLQPAAVDCGTAGRGRGGPPPAPPAGAPRAGGPGGPAMGCRVMMAPGRLTVAGQPLAQLATALGQQLGRPVIDKTGLTGAFDFELAFMPEGGRGGPVGQPPPGAPPLPPIDPDAPSLFTALQEQLGLKLEAERLPVDVVVIDSVEQPTED